MLQKKIKIKHPRGIHLKPATMIAQHCIKNQEVGVNIYKNEMVARGDSVMSILSLELSKGSTVTLEVDDGHTEVLEYIADILDGKYS